MTSSKSFMAFTFLVMPLVTTCSENTKKLIRVASVPSLKKQSVRFETVEMVPQDNSIQSTRYTINPLLEGTTFEEQVRIAFQKSMLERMEQRIQSIKY